MRYFLGIETSCDETAVGIFDAVEQKIIANTLFSQIDLHKEFGGVMPEVASRSHVEKIRPIFENALAKANLKISDIDHIGVTTKPGLFGSLLVGVCFAKGISFANNIALLGIDHNYGHILSCFLKEGGKIRDDLKFPFLCLSASGGHTSIFLVKSPYEYELISNTTDDAAGEAFDKVAKLLKLSYPGGPIVEKRAKLATIADVYSFPRGKDKNSLHFSFSGLKTAVLYKLVSLGVYNKNFEFNQDALSDEIVNNVCSSFQYCVSDIFASKLELAFQKYPDVTSFALVGGVSCNKFLVGKLEELSIKHQKNFFYPPREFCTDNGAMISLGCYFDWKSGKKAALDEIDIAR